MWRIFRFLSRFGNLILVLFLELVAILIVVTVNKPQREISQGIFSEFSGALSETQASIGGYFNLGTENKKLLSQNARLEQEILQLRDSLHAYRYRRPKNFNFLTTPDSVGIDSTLADSVVRYELPDSLLPVSGYEFVPCRAINNSVNLNYNYITLNKGSRNGVEVDMGVISPDGVAGQIIGVSTNYALALSVLNKKFRTSARLLGNNNMGVISWQGNDPGYTTLEFIPQTSTIHVGDTVESTGFSTVFPPNYIIGTVAEFDAKEQNGFYNVRVKLATNFRALDNLFLVRHRYKTEIDILDSLKSTEAGLKYFVLGALSSGLLLYGASLVYGFAGTTLFSGIIQTARGRFRCAKLAGK